MIRKFTIVLVSLLLYHAPLKAQSFHVVLDYQSFRPFIHFQLEFGTDRYPRSYRMAYLKGYMDGVNDHYRYEHRYRAMVRSVRAYKAGYRDGFRDRGMMIRLRGRDWLRRHQFRSRDYYSPAYSVRIWLKGLSLAFLKAPSRRLPPGWRRKVHPRVRRYRGWMKWRGHHRGYNDFDDYYEEYYEDDDDDYEDYYEEYDEDWEEDDEEYGYFKGVRKHYQKRVKKLRKRARKARKKIRKRNRNRKVLRRVDYERDSRRVRSGQSWRRGKAKAKRHKSRGRKEHKKRGRENRGHNRERGGR